MVYCQAFAAGYILNIPDKLCSFGTGSWGGGPSGGYPSIGFGANASMVSLFYKNSPHMYPENSYYM